MEIENRTIAMSASMLPKWQFLKFWVGVRRLKLNYKQQNQRLLSIHPKHMLELLHPIDFLISAVKLFAKFSYRLSSLTLRVTLNIANSDLICVTRPNEPVVVQSDWKTPLSTKQYSVGILITFLAQVRSRHNQIEKRISYCRKKWVIWIYMGDIVATQRMYMLV